MFKGYKVELDPNNRQKSLFVKHAGAARFAYNWGLARRIKEYETTGRMSSFVQQNKQLNAIKKDTFPWMSEVGCRAVQEALIDLELAYRRFFRRCKQGKSRGFPKFKTKKRNKPAFRLNTNIAIESCRVRLPRIGWVLLKEYNHLPIGKPVKTVTVKERAGRWFVSVQVEEAIAVPENQGSAIGLDLGLTSFVTGSDGTKVGAPKPLRKSLRLLQRRCRRLSRKQKGSKNREKARKRLARFHYRISCQRSDFLHKLSTKLAKTKSVIVVEDLNVAGMVRNRRLARVINDVSWAEFIRHLAYKCPWYGSKLVKVGRFFPSSKTCSNCGCTKDMPLSERQYCCGRCDLVLDRDLNAAKNILREGTASSAGNQACGEDVRPKAVAARRTFAKQEPSTRKGVGLGERKIKAC